MFHKIKTQNLVLSVSTSIGHPRALTVAHRYVISLTVSTMLYNFASCTTAYNICFTFHTSKCLKTITSPTVNLFPTSTHKADLAVTINQKIPHR